MSESVLSDMINKRAIIGFVTPRGSIEMTVAKILGLDDKFMKIRTDKEESDPKIITSGVISYLNISSIDSVVDASDDTIYKQLMASFQRQQQQQLAEMKRRQAVQQNQPANGTKEESS